MCFPTYEHYNWSSLFVDTGLKYKNLFSFNWRDQCVSRKHIFEEKMAQPALQVFGVGLKESKMIFDFDKF